MEHYSAEKWLDYIEGKVEGDKSVAMETHLAECESCLKLYALTAESSIVPQISPDFAERVMAGVKVYKRTKLTGTSKRQVMSPVTERNSRQSLGNYAVAACLTLLLTAGGIFANVASLLPTASGPEKSFADSAAEKVGYGWSETIAEKTISILDTIKPD